MSKRFLKMGLLGLMLAAFVQPSTYGQYRGRDEDGNRDDRSRWGGSDREREEMRRRFEEMRSRYGGGGDSRSPWGGGDSRSPWGGGGDQRSPWGGGFPGGGDIRGFDRGRDNDNDRDRRGDDRDRRDDDRSRSGDSRSGNSKSRVQPYVPTPHTAIGVDIPANYAGGDTDGDRQIDLLEWRQWRPQEIANFMIMDANRDGFLTARELIIAEKNPLPSSTPQAGNAQASNPGPAPTQVPAGPDADGNAPAAGEKPSAAEARYVFKQLDKNGSGKIEDDEWKGSKSIRGGFERQGIQLPLPADQATFFNLYPAQRIVPQLPLTN